MAINSLSTGFRPGVCTSSTRPTAPYEGQVIYETDTDLSYVWGGAAWQQVSGGTAVGNSGLVYVGGGALSTATTNFQSCFTSTYRNYRIVIDGISFSGVGDIYIRLLQGSSETAGALGNNYWAYNGITSAGSTTNSTANANVAFYLGMTSGGAGSPMGQSMIDIQSPQLAKVTTATVQSAYVIVGAYVTRNGMCAYDSATAQFDGFAVKSLSAVTLTGNVAIYGYRI
jgi:hypothetical protein